MNARRRAPALLALLAALLLLPGCLRLRQTFVLEPDGSGSVRIEHEYDPAALRGLRARVRALFTPPGTPIAADEWDARVNPVAPTWLTAAAHGGKDYRLTMTETQALEDGRTRVVAEGRFPSLESAARGEAFHGAEVRLERVPKDGWRFVLRDPWTPAGAGSSTVFGGLESAFVRAAFAEDLKALSRTLRMTFPGPVRITNGTLAADGRTVTWTSRADAEAPFALSAEFTLPAESAWATFRHHPDLGALSRRCLLPPPAPPVRAREE